MGSLTDGLAREGTFYVEPGNGLVLGSEPVCKKKVPQPEPGFIGPWIQFGRTADDYFYAISSFAVPSKGVDKLKLIWSEFNTGKILGTDLNDLLEREIEPSFTTRGDPRLFHFPDGQAGVFVERTGVVYKLTERVIS